MPKYYSKIILCIIGLIAVFIAGYYYYTRPVNSMNENIQITLYKNRLVEGALQPLPLIEKINTDWAMLGKALFNSTLLSADNTISCASCHHVNRGGDDGFPVSLGVDSKLGKRNSPTVINSSLNFKQFWDGRSPSLKKQIQEPIHNPVEMGTNFKQVINKLNKSSTFVKSFREIDSAGITEDNIIKAITTYQESLISYGSSIDKYLLGDGKALTSQQVRGLNKFKKFGCVTCHQGRNIGGNLFQKLGRIDEAPPSLLKDKGRFLITGDASDLHVFKVPSLRNVALTAPYFHDGSVDSLHEAVRLMGKMQLGVKLTDQDVNDIVALLNSFSGRVIDPGAMK